MFAVTELDKHIIVQRLQDGQQKKKEQVAALVAEAQYKGQKLKFGQLTQEGEAKSCGTKSILQNLGALSIQQKKKLDTAIKERNSGCIGWRKLQKEMSNILNIQIGSHETARRIADEFLQYS